MQVLSGDKEQLADIMPKKKLTIMDEIKNLIKATENIENAQGDRELNSKENSKPPIHAHTPLPGMSQLLPSLYLSGAGMALPHILDQLDVSFVINVTRELPDTPLSSRTKPMYLRIDVVDGTTADLASHFDEVADTIEEVRQSGGKTLVHCVAGVSRSATICLAYLMKHGGMSLREAYLYVKSIRPQIRPNTGFFSQLVQYEKQLRGSSSIKMIHLACVNLVIPDIYEPEYRATQEFYERQRKALRR